MGGHSSIYAVDDGFARNVIAITGPLALIGGLIPISAVEDGFARNVRESEVGRTQNFYPRTRVIMVSTTPFYQIWGRSLCVAPESVSHLEE
jgi:hypothetical protein